MLTSPRCLLILGTCALGLIVDPCAARVRAQATNPPLVGLNINSVNYYDGSYFFADCVKHAAGGWGTLAAPTPGGSCPTDAKGWPTQDCATLIAQRGTDVNGNPVSIGGTYHLQAKGRITTISAYASNFTTTNLAYNSTTNTTTADLVLAPTSGQLEMKFIGTSRDGSTPTASGTGFTDLKIMRPVAINSSTSYALTTTFTDQIKTVAGSFQVLRFMDFMGVNNSQETNWSDRQLPNRPWGARTWEYAIQFCNETSSDFYVNVPERATGTSPADTASYLYKLAQLIRYGSDADGNVYTSAQANPVHAPLASNLKVYIEYSNEIWNSASAFHDTYEYNKHAAIQEVVDSNFTSNLFYAGESTTYSGNDSEGDPAYSSRYNWTFRRHARRLKETSDIFRAVFGDEAMLARVRPLLEWQYANANNTASLELSFLDKIFNNGDGVAHSADPHPVGYYVWGGGGATYYGANNNGASTVDGIFASGVPGTGLADTMGSESLWAHAFGLHTAAYEGGWSVSNAGDVQTTTQRQAKLDPRARQAAIDFQKMFDAVGGDLNMVYRDAGTDQWGLCDPTVYANTNPPQIQGYIAAQSADRTLPSSGYHPGFGTLAPGTVTGADSHRAGVGGTTNGTVLIKFGTGCWSSYLFEVPTGGNYYISCSVGTSQSGGLLDIMADGQLVGTVAIPNTGAYGTYQNTASAIAYLPAGTHAIRVQPRAGGANLGSVTVSGGVTVVRQIACGSTVAVGSFAADNSHNGGFVYSGARPIYTSGNQAQQAPMAVYQTQRSGTFTYTLAGLGANAAYQVRLHFAELYYGPVASGSGAGKRFMDVVANGTSLLTHLDVNGRTGGGDKALVYQFTVTSDAAGKIALVFSKNAGSGDNNALVSAIEVLQ